MAEEISRERDFTREIERLLDGEEVGAGENTGDDYRAAIVFAQKMISLRSDPSPRFKDQLKRRLLQKLAEGEAEAAPEKEKGNWLGEVLRNLIPRNPVWRTAMATVAVAVVATVVVWGSGTFTQAPQPERLLAPAPVMAPSPPAGLEIQALPLRSTAYAAGDEITITLAFRNMSPEPVTIAAFPPAIQITRAETGELVRFLPGGSDRIDILPSVTLEYTISWDQTDDRGRQVPAGRYSVSLSEAAIGNDAGLEGTQQGFEPLTEVIIQSP